MAGKKLRNKTNLEKQGSTAIGGTRFDMSELVEMSQAIDRELPAWLDQMLGR